MTDPKTNYQKVREFHQKFGATLDQEYTHWLASLRMDLISEEFCEVVDEFDPELYEDDNHVRPFDNRKAAKELADLFYVVYGTAAAFGIDIDKVFDKVHQNNMSKMQPDGIVLYREDGKVLKPEGYTPIDLATLLD